MFAGSCRGFEAAQVGSATCIEVGTDFTLPYDRDLGVVLTIGMTPYEVFRTSLLAHRQQMAAEIDAVHNQPVLPKKAPDHIPKNYPMVQHWGYYKHNMVTGSAPAATHILHAAGIAFAVKLRRAAVVTVAYCDEGATTEPDFREGLEFATQHQLPMICICEQSDLSSSLQSLPFLHSLAGLTYDCVDGTDVVSVYLAMQAAIHNAREGRGPVLLEARVRGQEVGQEDEQDDQYDPLLCCRRYLEEQGAWDEEWATGLRVRLEVEVEQAMRDAMRDVGRLE